MLFTLIFVLFIWLPTATLVHAVVQSSEIPRFANGLKKLLYYVLVFPAIYASWLLAVLAIHDGVVEKLSKLGDWFKT